LINIYSAVVTPHLGTSISRISEYPLDACKLCAHWLVHSCWQLSRHCLKTQINDAKHTRTHTHTEMIDGKMKLKPILSFTPFAREHSGIVDKDVQPTFVCCTSTSSQLIHRTQSNSRKTVLLELSLTAIDWNWKWTWEKQAWIEKNK